MSNLSGRDFINIYDFTKKEFEKLLADSVKFKENSIEHADLLLSRKALGMIFANPSTRTRTSFESAMVQLGGHAFNYRLDELQLANRETYSDTAKVVSRYLQGMLIRWYGGPYLSGRKAIEEFAEGATIPVINGNDDLEHPCQALADVMTIREKLRTRKRIRLVIMWGYSDRVKPLGAVHSLGELAAKVGINTTLVFPKGYDIDVAVQRRAEEDAKLSGTEMNYSNDLHQGLAKADVVYLKNWRRPGISEDQEKLYRSQRKSELQQWRLTPDLMKLTNNAIFMHPLPIERGIEASDEVIDGPSSVVLDEAENRLHAQKAVLANIMV